MTYEGLQKGQEADRYLFQARYGREDIAEYEGLKAFLFLEGEQEGQADPVEAAEVADLLMTHQVPIAILNACQSGKQVGEVETSLGSRLMQAGVQMVLAMGYKVTVSAAALMMETLYPELFAGEDLSTAIRRARLELYNQKGRRAYFNQMIDLEDWILPVVYQNRPVHLAVREFTEEEHKAYYEREAELYEAPTPTYGFHGRDLDVLEIERRLLRHNLLLLRGMGGAGKTTLLRHLGAWWQTTNFVDQVFYFGYDERAWNRQQIMHEIARRLLSGVEFAKFQPMSLNAQQKQLAKKLRAHRHLLLLDNMESITGAHLAIQNTLPDNERDDLRRFLAALSGGRTLVLMGSRGGEAWLTGKAGPGNPPIREEHLYDLPGLDAEAASSLADRILESHDATRYRDDDDYQRLLTLLDGYPLPMEIIFANLARQTPADILEALQAGDEDLDVDLGGKEGGKHKSLLEAKTESILKCIDYSHSNLSPDAQALLTCLAPFTGVINRQVLEPYTQHLKQQPALADLDFDKWQEVLQEAINWGLLSPHEVQGFLRLQPIFPYFPRSRLAEQEQDAWREAVNAAFRALYDQYGGEMGDLLQSKKAEEKQLGQILVRLEYENLSTALDLALAAQESSMRLASALSFYLDATQDQRRGLELGEKVLAKLEEYSPEKLSGPLGVEFAAAIDDLAKRQFQLRRYTDAEASYQKALSLVKATTAYEEEGKAKLIASAYHQLGMVAQKQRQWAQAEQYYQQVLAIYVEYNDRYKQAGPYHQLGVVAQEQRQWLQAEQYYQQALAIYVEFNDRYEQAGTYHHLGRVALAQRQWVQAEQYYQQTLATYVEYNDRYSQALTYHNLGFVAEEQRQWLQAEQYYQQALATYVEYNDEHNLGIVLRSLARLWKASGDDSIPGAIAPILNVEPAEVVKVLQGYLDQSDEDEGGAE